MLDLSKLQLVAHPGPKYDADTATMTGAEEKLFDAAIQLVQRYVLAVELANSLRGGDCDAYAKATTLRAVNTVALAAAMVVSAKYGTGEDLNAVIKQLYNSIDDAVSGWAEVNAEEAATAPATAT